MHQFLANVDLGQYDFFIGIVAGLIIGLGVKYRARGF
jgi:hypothetical protein